MIRPIVYLIGAGPGDPGLMTMRGRRCLAAADVVLYDRLVHPRLLGWARADAERIDVGLTGLQTVEHEAVCYLLAEKAREGKIVARLTWGDSFAFGRGAEEAVFLSREGLAFEVVPGVPLLSAVTSYAGIPVTYPGAGDAVTFLRIDEEDGRKLPAINWDSLVRLGGTFVCYAGPRRLQAILDALIAHGASPAEPAAIIYQGTLPQQDTVEGTLDEVARAVREAAHGRPGTLVVGRVVAFRDELRWFDARPLFGRRILVTRPREQAGDLVDALEGLGAVAIEAPTIRIVPPDDYGPLDEACAKAGTFDWIVFTSVNGVEQFMRRLEAGPGDLRDLKGVRLCAIGPGTADRLAAHGLKVDLMPAEFRAEALVQALRASGDVAGRRILLPRADIARELLADELRRAGAEVVEVAAYRTLPTETSRNGDPDVYRLLLDQKIDVVTFTSASTVRNFVQIYGGPEAVSDLLRATTVACIGPVTAETAEQYHIHTAIVPAEYTIPGMVHAIVEYFGKAAQQSET